MKIRLKSKIRDEVHLKELESAKDMLLRKQRELYGITKYLRCR